MLSSRTDVYCDDMFGFSLTVQYVHIGLGGHISSHDETSVCNVTIDITNSKTDWSRNRGLSTVSDRKQVAYVRIC